MVMNELYANIFLMILIVFIHFIAIIIDLLMSQGIFYAIFPDHPIAISQVFIIS